MKIPRDTLWKGIIEDLFQELIAFFFPQEFDQFDFSEVIFLDKELEKLFPQSVDKKRIVDKLIQVKLINGEKQWILIHIEIQGYKDPKFQNRMFRYFYGIFHRYDRPVMALAIFTDKHKSYHPNSFHLETFGTVLHYQFPTYKLFNQDPKALANDPNPFALVMLTAYEAIKNPKKPEDPELLEQKISLYRKCLERGYSSDKIQKLTDFIKYYVHFAKPEMNVKFDKVTLELNQSETNMGIRERILAHAEKIGEERGLKKGEEKGIGKGDYKRKVKTTQRVLKSHLYQDGLATYADIAHMVELTEEEVEKIHKEME